MLTGSQKKKAVDKMKYHGEKGNVCKRGSWMFEKENWTLKKFQIT